MAFDYFCRIVFLTLLAFVPAKGLEPLLLRWEPQGWDNFGDALSQPLVERILGKKVKREWEGRRDQSRVLAIGSILHLAENGNTIWGSGSLSGWLPEQITRLDVRAVRGPFTRDLLLSRGIPCPPVYGDPGLLYPRFFPEFKREPKRPYSVIPHASEISLFESDPYLVSPLEPWEIVIRKIVESEFVIASSLHGIILAEAYGVPARMVLATNHWQFFKYQDYYNGTGRPDFRYASTIQEALEMGGEKPPQCDLEGLLNSFPFDLWESPD